MKRERRVGRTRGIKGKGKERKIKETMEGGNEGKRKVLKERGK